MAVSSFDSDEDLNSSFISLLECPVCLTYMIPPIFQCLNGHNVCSTCIKSLNICPVCRERLEDPHPRNLFAEKIAEKCVFPCKFAENGCNETFKLALIRIHESKCPFRMYNCLVMNQNCKWQGLQNELFDHTTKNHAEKAWDTEVINFTASEEFGITRFKEKAIVSIYNELFLISIHWEEVQKKLFGTVQIIGQTGDSTKFKYKFEFNSDNNQVVHRHVVCSEEEDEKDIYQAGKCLCIDTSLAVLFKKDNKVSFKLSISSATTAVLQPDSSACCLF